MTSAAQKKAVRTHRKRLRQSGMGRFEVQGRLSDKEFLRQLARKLAGGDAEADRVRGMVTNAMEAESSSTGAVWAWLRSSPLVDSGIAIDRVRSEPRKIDL